MNAGLVSASTQGRGKKFSKFRKTEKTDWEQSESSLDGNKDSFEKINTVDKQKTNSIQARKVQSFKEAAIHKREKFLDQRSLYIFHYTYKIRFLIVWFIEWKLFEYFIILIILGNSIVLSMYDYSDRDSNTPYNQSLDKIQLFFTVVFVVECVLKVIAYGFVIKKNSYLRDGWNIIDFIVVIFGITDFLPGNTNLKSLRVLRVLRPLRSINAIKRMKQLVNTLIRALPNFGNVSIFLFFIFILFGIIGLQMYNDSFYWRCRTTPEPIMSSDNKTYTWPKDPSSLQRLCSSDGQGIFSCPAGTYCGNPSEYQISREADGVYDDAVINYGITTFDNIGKSLLTEFQILTNDNWAATLYNIMDTEVSWIASIYFCFLVIFGSFFLLNIVLAVILDSFTKVQQEDMKNQLQQNQDKFDKVYEQIEKDQQKEGIVPEKEEIKESDSRNQSFHSSHNDSLIDEQVVTTQINKTLNTSKDLLVEENKDSEADANQKIISDQILKRKRNTAFNVNQLIKSLNDELPQRDNNLANQFEKKRTQQDPNFLRVEDSFKQTHISMAKINNNTAMDAFSRAMKMKHNQYKLKSVLQNTKRRQSNYQQCIALKRAIKTVEKNQKIQRTTTQVLEKRSKKNKFIRFFVMISKSKSFTYFISLVIILNTIALALDKYPIDLEVDQILQKINIGFFIIFFLEMIIKLIGFGIKDYFRNAFNTFDCLVVIISCIDVVLQYAISSESGDGNGNSNGAISALRAFRLLRIFKLAKSWKKFQDLLKIIGHTLKDISTFSILLFLFIFIYTLLGLELFAFKCKKTADDKIDLINGTAPIFNFDSFLDSFITVFILLTGDGWTTIMFDYYRAVGAGPALFYFISFMLIGQFVLLNLFLAILLQNFDEDSIDQEKHKKEVQEKHIKKRRFQKLLALLFKKLKRFFQRIFNQDESNKLLRGITYIDDNNDEKYVDKEKSKRKASFFLKSISKNKNEITLKGNFVMMSGKSLWLFSLESRLRRFIYRIVTHSKFDYLILIVITLSSIQLALDNPLDDPNGHIQNVLFYIDLSTTAIFTVEMIFKIIAFGLIVSLSASQDNLKIIKIFRLMRVLRPLKVISKNEGLKVAIQAMSMAVPNILNVLVISMLFFIIFGIIGVNYFKGEFYYCLTDQLDKNKFSSLVKSIYYKHDCLNSGGEWLEKYFHFDNIINAIQSLFQIATLSGWSDVMITGMSISGIDTVLQMKSKPMFFLFFIVFVIVGAFFTLNLFVGIVISTFNREKERIGKDFMLTEKQSEWLDVKQLIFRLKPKRKIIGHQNKFRQLCFQISTHQIFEKVILVSIILNTIFLMLKWSDEPAIVSKITEIFNYIFTAIFIFEATAKIIAFGKSYFSDRWNLFDLFVVILTTVSIIFSQVTLYNFGPQTTLIRSFRILRIFRLIKRAKSLKIMINTFIVTLPAMTNIGGLLGILLFIYAILGVNLFAPIKIIEPLNDIMNFQTFGNSFLVLIKLATGDGWPEMLNALIQENTILNKCIDNPSYDDYVNNGNQPMGCGQYESALIFFYSFILIVKLVFLNLFIAIILQGFDDTNEQDQRTFNIDLAELFVEKWADIDPDATGYIKIVKLDEFLYSLGRPLGWDETYRNNTEKQEEFKSQMTLQIYHEFKDYKFFDVLQSLCLIQLIEESIQLEKQGQGKDKALRNRAKSVSELKKEIEALNDNDENIHKVESLKDKESKLRIKRKQTSNQKVFKPVHEQAARLLIKHLRAFVQRKRLQKGQEVRRLSVEERQEIDDRLVEKFKEFKAEQESSEDSEECIDFDDEYEKLSRNPASLQNPSSDIENLREELLDNAEFDNPFAELNVGSKHIIVERLTSGQASYETPKGRFKIKVEPKSFEITFKNEELPRIVLNGPSNMDEGSEEIDIDQELRNLDNLQ